MVATASWQRFETRDIASRFTLLSYSETESVSVTMGVRFGWLSALTWLRMRLKTSGGRPVNKSLILAIFWKLLLERRSNMPAGIVNNRSNADSKVSMRTVFAC